MPRYEEEVAELKADGQTVVMDLLHRGAFRGRGLGNTIIGSPHHADQFVTSSYGNAVKDFVKTFYTPQNIVIVGSGVEHEEFLQWLKPFSSPSAPLSDQNIDLTAEYKGPFAEKEFATPPQRTFNQDPSKYVGGEATETSESHDTHVALAFEGGSTKDKDGVVLEVLKYLFGGARQKSGEGSGTRHSRLGSKVVFPNHWVDEAVAFNIPYSDSGLFGFYARSHENSHKLLDLLAREVQSVLKNGVKEEEIARAKAFLKVDVTENKRIPTLQFVGQQVFITSHKQCCGN
jgi:mitochondrial-processing peptidase subunit alpha